MLSHILWLKVHFIFHRWNGTSVWAETIWSWRKLERQLPETWCTAMSCWTSGAGKRLCVQVQFWVLLLVLNGKVHYEGIIRCTSVTNRLTIIGIQMFRFKPPLLCVTINTSFQWYSSSLCNLQWSVFLILQPVCNCWRHTYRSQTHGSHANRSRPIGSPGCETDFFWTSKALCSTHQKGPEGD